MTRDLNRVDQDGRDGGFSLTELIVVVAILAVLVAVSIPVFLGARRRGQDRAAQFLARDALVSAKTVFQGTDDYLAATVTSLQAAEPGTSFVPGSVSSSGPKIASVDSPDASTFIAAVFSRSGSCFFIRDRVTPQGGTRYASRSSDGTDCAAASPPGEAEFTGSW